MEERRQFIRVAKTVEATFKIQGLPGNGDAVTINNLSLSGASFDTHESLANGSHVELRLVLPDNQPPVVIRGEVIWQLPAHNHQSRTGIKFSITSPGVKDRLIHYVTSRTKNIAEKREYVRCPLETNIRRNILDDPGTSFYAKSSDISKGGMKLSLKEHLETGTRLRVLFNLPHDKESIIAEAKIVWKKPGRTGETEIGIIFVEIKDEDKTKVEKYTHEHHS